MEFSLRTGRISWCRAEVNPASRIYVTPSKDILKAVSFVHVMLEVKRTRPIVALGFKNEDQQHKEVESD